MWWVIQNNIFSEENFDVLVGTLERLGLGHSLHKVVPFTGELTDEHLVPEGVPVVVMGSYSLARRAVKMGWRPGAFLDNLDFVTQREHWGDRMLNADALTTTLDDVPMFFEPKFLRPVHDTKSFTGQVIDWPAFEAWRRQVEHVDEDFEYIEKSVVHYPGDVITGCECPQCDPERHDATRTLTLGTPVMLCSKKEIYSETRVWIIDEAAVTASGYKLGTLKRYTRPEEVDARIVEFAEECAAAWSPNRAYCLDVADTPYGLKIVEVNNINSAGWYRCDMQRLVEAIEGMR